MIVVAITAGFCLYEKEPQGPILKRKVELPMKIVHFFDTFTWVLNIRIAFSSASNGFRPNLVPLQYLILKNGLRFSGIFGMTLRAIKSLAFAVLCLSSYSLAVTDFFVVIMFSLFLLTYNAVISRTVQPA